MHSMFYVEYSDMVKPEERQMGQERVRFHHCFERDCKLAICRSSSSMI
jgi:hypothetical protein